MANLTQIANRASALRPGLMVLLLPAVLALACASARAMQAPGGEEPAKKASGAKAAADDKTKKAEPGTAGGSGNAATPSGEKDGSAATPGDAQTPDEQREGLDRQLEKSLSAFDEMLLKEQQAAAAKRAAEAQSGGGAGGGTGGGEGGGAGEGQAGGQGQGQQGERGRDGRSGATGRRTASGTGGESGAETDRATGSSRGGSRTTGGRTTASAPEGTPPSNDAGVPPPPDVGDGRDDDVVARQIREAAMNEKDPAIRERLWDEYRRYKGITSGTK